MPLHVLDGLGRRRVPLLPRAVIFLVRREDLSKAAPRPIYAALYRPFLYLQYLGRLLVGEAQKIAEDHHYPETFIQCEQSGLHLVGQAVAGGLVPLPASGSSLHGVRSAEQMVQLLLSAGFVTPRAQVVMDRVYYYAMQPRAETGIAPESIQRGEGFDESLLSCVRRAPGVTQHAQSQVVCALLM